MITYKCKCGNSIQAVKDSLIRCSCKRIMKPIKIQRVTKRILEIEMRFNRLHQLGFFGDNEIINYLF